MSKKALIVVDVQEDFVNGSLAILGAPDILDLIRKETAEDKYDYIIATADWHPKNHCSFVENGGQWPAHCVLGTDGSDPVFDFDESIKDGEVSASVWFKGLNPDIDSYSAFKDNDGNDLGFALYLKSLGVDEVYVCGLALDYCVKYTALDAKGHGFKVTLLESLTRSVDPENDDVVSKELLAAGVSIVTHEG